MLGFQQLYTWAGKMAQQVRELVAKSNDMSLISGTHMVKEENDSSKLSSDYPLLTWQSLREELPVFGLTWELVSMSPRTVFH